MRHNYSARLLLLSWGKSHLQAFIDFVNDSAFFKTYKMIEIIFLMVVRKNDSFRSYKRSKSLFQKKTMTPSMGGNGGNGREKNISPNYVISHLYI